VDGCQPTRLRTGDVLGQIVEKYDAVGRHTDRLHHVIIGLGIGLSKPDLGGGEDFAEMAEQVGKPGRKIFDVRNIGIGEGVKRQAPCGARKKPPHVALLAQSRAACDRLVVGLNSDESIARLKGANRPVQPEAARAAVLASLASVDLVVVFAEDTPLALIEAIRPDILVKGADYRVEEVVGADIVQSYGGKVLLADLIAGHSTTATIKKIGTR